MPMNRTGTLALALGGLLALGSAAPGAGQEAHEQHAHGGAHGQVEFPVSCQPDVRADFQRAVGILHSFGYEEARHAFQAIAERNPSCGMAYWGIAMTYYHQLWAPPTPDELAAGRAAAEEAVRLGADTPRERAYIEAIAEFYREPDRRDHGARARAHRDAMGRMAAEFSTDDEAKIFHALAILGAAPPGDPTYAEQKRAAEILSAMLPKYPRHPGIAHYTIHAFDYPELAELALPAARIYAELAPESPHALHMPTHIFTRLGLWRESIDANLACVARSNELVARTDPGSVAFEALHCQDYMAYAYLQLGEDEKARDVLEEVASARRFDDPNFAVGYAILAVPARYAMERRDWKAAARLTIPDVDVPWEHYPYGKGITYFANAVGAARSGDVSRARAAVEKLESLQASIAEEGLPGGPYDWVRWLEAKRQAAAGWLALAEGRSDEAVRLLTAAAELEERVGKSPITPGPILPPRELLGDLLLELERPAEALAAYEAALADSPRRFNGLAGAARAARAAGDREKTAVYYEALVELASASEARAAELDEARAYLAARRAGGG